MPSSCGIPSADFLKLRLFSSVRRPYQRSVSFQANFFLAFAYISLVLLRNIHSPRVLLPSYANNERLVTATEGGALSSSTDALCVFVLCGLLGPDFGRFMPPERRDLPAKRQRPSLLAIVELY